VNRPFFAFGVLLALLALAMVAVSSTGRPTRPPATPQAADGSQLAPRPGAIYVVVLPEGDEQPATINRLESNLKPICIVPAHADGAGQTATAPGDCRSHYDPQYDRLIYGDTAEAAAAGSPKWSRAEASADELLAIFRSLGASNPSLWWKDLREQFLQSFARLQPVLRGIQNRQLRLAVRWGWRRVQEDAEPAVSWNDYAELIDSIDPPAEAVAQGPVRSGGWLLHFAVSSLSRMGLALEQAAAELQRFECEPAEVDPKAAD